MGNNKGRFGEWIIVALFSVMVCACSPDIACPTGHIDAKALAAGASNGKGTEKKRTQNGLIKAKKPKSKSKKRR